MHNDIIFKLKPHKTQISLLFVPLIIGLFSLLGDDSKVFFLSLSVIVIFLQDCAVQHSPVLNSYNIFYYLTSCCILLFNTKAASR